MAASAINKDLPPARYLNNNHIHCSVIVNDDHIHCSVIVIDDHIHCSGFIIDDHIYRSVIVLKSAFRTQQFYGQLLRNLVPKTTMDLTVKCHNLFPKKEEPSQLPRNTKTGPISQAVAKIQKTCKEKVTIDRN